MYYSAWDLSERGVRGGFVLQWTPYTLIGTCPSVLCPHFRGGFGSGNNTYMHADLGVDTGVDYVEFDGLRVQIEFTGAVQTVLVDMQNKSNVATCSPDIILYYARA